MTSHIVQITNRAEHDQVVDTSKQTPTVIYVSNSSHPACREHNPKYEELVKRKQDTGVRFAQMEFNTDTSMLFKFAPNQLPVTVLMVRDAWCKTFMGPDMRGLEEALEMLVQEAKKGGLESYSKEPLLPLREIESLSAALHRLHGAKVRLVQTSPATGLHFSHHEARPLPRSHAESLTKTLTKSRRHRSFTMAFTANQKRKLTPTTHKLTWTHEMRVVLHMIFEEFVFDKAKKKEIFDTIFQEHIAKCGLTDGTSRAYASQVAEASNSEVPLSAQAAIGHWQPDTPIVSRGKRSRRDSAAAPHPKRQQLNEMVLAQGTILHHRQPSRQGASKSTSTRKASTSSSLARTPTKIVGKKKTQVPKSPRTRRDGTIIRIPDQEEINVEVAPVAQNLAQPDLPDLLFRWWKKDPECDRDSENGFWSRKHHNSNAIPLTPPKACSIDATDILNHMDRKMKETPFISTTDRLLWMVQRIIKGIQAGQENMYLSVISVKELDPRAVFHARAFHDAVRPTRGFSNGAQNYRGCSEWLVWRDIPKRAIIRTFEATELIDMIDSNPGIASALRLEVLRGRECLNTKKVPLLRRQNIALSADTIPAIANVAIFLGLNAHSAMEHITHIVRDIVEGWGLTLKKQTEQDWQHLAGVFEEELCRHSPSPITLRTRVCVQTAFLSGVAAGTGKVNYRFKPDLLPQQQERAALLGLASPAAVIAHSLDGAKLTVLAPLVGKHADSGRRR
ncbi:uncharacterized protein MYCGRDRAFT_93083 [Zymoseptoria tritici IPO323]|uniref:DUF7587 domain-containing protein n=1 Tax=Zymoseptoria tritici (strain CBS 115943 / IPO323) TaxID=336722 RepID=F9XBA3_ZYMTI|nr:uncharacterized protein MYCGRDRAFT_93083 [Zymoseptoria tritici IPO323]EGP87685.1 hypothetical protein MYCGRDRAFT_93083 [Zymoseptoria tritici IPO323]